MLNKKVLKSLPLVRPKKVKELFNTVNKLNAVVDFHVKNVDKKRMFIVDIFLKDFAMRTFIHSQRGNYEYATYSYKTKRWSVTPILNMRVHSDNYGYDYLFLSKNYALLHKEVAISYLGLKSDCITNEFIIGAIHNIQTDIKKKAAQKKAVLAKKFLDKVPELSDKQKKWAISQFEDQKTLYPYFFTKIKGIPILRHFRVYRNKRQNTYRFEEFGRDIVYKGKLIKYQATLWNNFIWKKGRSFDFDTYILPSRFREGPLYMSNLKSVLKGTELEYSAITEYERLLKSNGYTEDKWDVYISGYLKYPQIEYLVKEGILYLTNSIIYSVKHSRTSYSGYLSYSNLKALNAKGKTICDFLNITKNFIPFLKTHPMNLFDLVFIQKYIRKGISLTENDFEILFSIIQHNAFGDRTVYNFLDICKMLHPSIHKALKYLVMQNEQNKFKTDKECFNGLEQKMSLFNDYIKFATELKYDLTSKVKYFPRDIEKAHDEASVHLKSLKDKELYSSFKAFRQELESFNNIKIGEYVFKIPTGDEQFVCQGRELKQCIGNGTYFKKMANREIIICFINRVESPDIPYLTLEIKGGTVAQLRGYKNSNPDSDAAMAVNHYVRLLNKSVTFSEEGITVNTNSKLELISA